MATRTINGVTLALIRGNIVEVHADAIVNAANSGLRGGGGVDGAIHRAGGPSIMEECRKIGGCPTGEAVVTTAGRLPAKYVFHAVGPIYSGSIDDVGIVQTFCRLMDGFQYAWMFLFFCITHGVTSNKSPSFIFLFISITLSGVF